MKTLFISVKIFLVLTILTGIIYPLLITGLAQLIFPHQANGSMVIQNGKVLGSELIGQNFNNRKYFWSRPSAVNYNPLPSGGSNYGPTSKALKQQVIYREKSLQKANSLPQNASIPSEMIFASASGLDPHISPQAALMQVDRISKERNFIPKQKEKLLSLITNLTEKPQFRLFGEERINVFLLNLELDKITR
ncbi:MAG: potassium-transporting ATPase subunit KdpC [Bacteroidota bacterium]|nr:potassium-transporting ATPase subunit KdpC [Bacteroidota bacterium]